MAREGVVYDDGGNAELRREWLETLRAELYRLKGHDIPEAEKTRWPWEAPLPGLWRRVRKLRKAIAKAEGR